MAEHFTRRLHAARGVLFVHSSLAALGPHVEWAVGRVLGEPVNFDWTEQPVLPGTQRAEFYWEGPQGTAARIASSLLGWEQLRFEVSEDPSPGCDGGRWLHTPRLGVFHAHADAAGNLVVPEDRLRAAMESAGGDAIALHAELRAALGQDWDDELEPFRHASDFAPVIWLHQVG
ncbi:DUF3145 domain-containing protein [Agromyces seonyuensis]|uniref:DUF3145 family protein n=1 Tax=Agromyces seonyuensis TaxID=2662446 RepID=A0A6I4P3G1_9MICO|nr:DUF3145 domain-containing protein [Agromyces seonyuensis]MWB97764.1 DUF3145 family protein [Agromyces seonyuensis]